MAREVLASGSSRTDTPLPFAVESLNDTTAASILTDHEDPYLRYTFRNTATAQYDPLFVRALSWNLAAELAMPLTQSQNVLSMALTMYQAIIGAARSAANHERFDGAVRDAASVTARA
jgi:hypothetical protein